MAQDRRIRNGRNKRLRLSNLASSALNCLGVDGFCPQGGVEKQDPVVTDPSHPARPLEPPHLMALVVAWACWTETGAAMLRAELLTAPGAAESAGGLVK